MNTSHSLKNNYDIIEPEQEEGTIIPLSKEEAAAIEKRNLHSQIGHIKEKHNELNKLTADFGEQTKHLTSKMVDMQSKFGALTSKLDSVEGTTQELSQTSRNLTKKTQALTYKTDDLIKKTDQLDKRTNELEKTTKSVTSRVDILEPKSDNLFVRTDDLKAKSESLDSRTDLLHNQVKKAIWAFAVILTILAVAGASTLYYTNWNMDKMKPAIIESVSQTIAQDVAELKMSKSQLQSQISEIDNKIGMLERSKQSLTNQMELMNVQVSDIDQRLVAEEKFNADVKSVLKDSSIIFNDIHNKNWVTEQPTSNWTIQLMCATVEKGAINFVNAYNYYEPLAYYKTIYKNREWFVVMAGSYASLEEAKAAAQKLPQALKAGKPWIRSFADIQGRIEKYDLKS